MPGHAEYSHELKSILGKFKDRSTKVIVGGIMKFRNLGVNSRK